MPAVTWRDNKHLESVAYSLGFKLGPVFRSLTTEERHFLTEALRNACHSAPAVESNLFGLLRDLGWPGEPREKLAGEA